MTGAVVSSNEQLQAISREMLEEFAATKLLEHTLKLGLEALVGAGFEVVTSREPQSASYGRVERKLTQEFQDPLSGRTFRAAAVLETRPHVEDVGAGTLWVAVSHIRNKTTAGNPVWRMVARNKVVEWEALGAGTTESHLRTMLNFRWRMYFEGAQREAGRPASKELASKFERLIAP